MAASGPWRQAAAALLRGRSEATVLSALSPGQPDGLLTALAAEARARDIRLTLLAGDLSGGWGFLTEGDEPRWRDGRLRLVALAGSVPRRLSAAVGFYPHSLYEIDRYIANGRIAADIFVARVSQASATSGYTLGPMVGYSPASLGRIGCVGFEVGEDEPSVGPQAVIERERPTVVCPASGPGRPPAGSGETGRAAGHPAAHDRIGRLAADLVPEDATLQLGLGAAPEAVVPYLAGKRSLGLHSGILPGSLWPLIASGAITGAKKSHGQGLHLATGVLSWPPGKGDGRLQLEPVSVTHAPDILRQQHRLWAINSAFEVDLLGQVNAEYAGGVRVASGGGQGDFFRAAHQCDGGAAVLVMPARTKDGRSRVVADLGSSRRVTTAAADVDYVVTDFGVAHLTAATAAQRAERLTAIAHPEDREELRRNWNGLFG